MTALTEDRDTRRKEGDIGQGPVAASAKLYGGAFVCFNASGYLVAGADTAGLILAGICRGQKDNSSGADGDLTAEFERDGLHIMIMDMAITRADLGKKVFLVDDQTADLEGNVSNAVFCGVIAEYISATKAYIDIEPAILDENTPYVPDLIADPGDAGAISVSRSGCCAITTADAETRTLGAPGEPGLDLSLSLDVDGGNCVITAASAINQTGNNTITMADAGDTLFLESVQVAGANVWRTRGNDGCSLSTV